MDVNRFWFNGRVEMFSGVRKAIRALPKDTIVVTGRQRRSGYREGIDFVVEVRDGLHIYALHPRTVKVVKYPGDSEDIPRKRDDSSFEYGEWNYHVHWDSKRIK